MDIIVQADNTRELYKKIFVLIQLGTMFLNVFECIKLLKKHEAGYLFFNADYTSIHTTKKKSTNY